jgi:hypothetical protein
MILRQPSTETYTVFKRRAPSKFHVLVKYAVWYGYAQIPSRWAEAVTLASCILEVRTSAGTPAIPIKVSRGSRQSLQVNSRPELLIRSLKQIT